MAITDTLIDIIRDVWSGGGGAGNLRVDGSGVTQPVSGTVSLSAATTATLTSISRSATSQVVVASNASRKGLVLFNDTAAICYVAFAATSTSSAFTLRLTSNDLYEMPLLMYTGVVSVIWGSGGANNLLAWELT